MLTGLLCLVQGALATPDADSIAKVWADTQVLLAAYGRTAAFHLDARDIDALAKEKVVKNRGAGAAGVQRVDSAVWMPIDAHRIWLAIHDDQHNDLNASLEEKVVSLGDKGEKVLYQSLGLPIPFDDRFWVIRITNNAEIYAASEHRVLERTWDLHPDGRNVLPPELREASLGKVWTPVNRGTWMVISIGDQSSLVLYRVESDVGGFVPDGFVGRFTAARVDDLMTRMRQTAQVMETHYTEEHHRIVLPDGQEVPPWPGVVP